MSSLSKTDRVLAWGTRPLQLALVLVCASMFQQTALASPYGQGIFNEDVPFGAATSLSIALGGNVALNLAPSGGNFTATNSHVITVTSTDVVGYTLYAYSPTSTTMTTTSSSDTIPASANVSPAALAVNTWGYNTNGSSNFIGMTTRPAVIKDATGPYKSGDNTTVTYSALTNITKSAGTYTIGVTYIAVCKTD